MRRGTKIWASVEDVVERIEKVVHNPALADRMIQEVVEYAETKNPSRDLKPEEQRLLYRDEDFGGQHPMSRRKLLNINWTDHAEYRSDLRDVDPQKVNQAIADRLRPKLQNPDSRKVNFKEPGLGTMVVDYNLGLNPAEADVITVWAKEASMKKIEAIAARVAAVEAEKRYQFWRRSIDSRMKELGEKLRKHDDDFMKDPGNWGYVGDVAHVDELLERLTSFLWRHEPLADFYSSELCQSRTVCKRCRSDRRYRTTIATLFSVPMVDFPCPHGYGENRWPPGTVPDKPEETFTRSEAEVRECVEACERCPSYAAGVCRRCNCRVQVKAALKAGHCPLGRW